MPRNNLISLRKGTASDWGSLNSVLNSGEPGFDISNNQLKIGDGISTWSGLVPVNYNLNNYDITGTGNININGNVISNTGVFDLVEFNINTEIEPDEGQLTWNSTYGTLDLGFTDTYSLHVGQETHFRVRNSTGSTLYKAQAVFATGIHNDNVRLTIDKYAADGVVREIRFIGLVSEDIDNNQSGYTTNFGYIRGNETYSLDTRGNVASPIAVGNESWNQGDVLYVHPTVAGKLTKVEPQHSISVAIIVRVHQTEGVLLVRPTTFGHLEDNHDVSYSGLVDNNLLVWNSGLNTWEPSNDLYYIDGNMGIGTSNPTYKLEVDGSFSATTKSFKIKHPSKTGSILEYGSLESPYHGIRLTGKDKLKNGVCTVVLPDYIKDLVREEDINFQITNYKHHKTLYVDKIDLKNNQITIKGYRCKSLGILEFFWTFTAVRKDVEPLVVEK